MLDHLRLALSRPFGIALSAPDPQATAQALHRARANAHEPSFAQLTIHQREGEVWIVRHAAPEVGL